MVEIGPKHDLSYRKEVLHPIFELIRSGEAGCVVSAAGMGKTRLIDFLFQPDVQRHYLGEEAESTLVVRMDLHLLGEWNEWGFFELMLNSLAQSCNGDNRLADFQKHLIQLDTEVIRSRDKVIAFRFVQHAIQNLCKMRGYNLGFIFDEFDDGYKNLPAEIFTHLRGIYTENEHSLTYILVLRDFPGRIRPPAENPYFYEIIARNLIGLGPYNQPDSMAVMQQVEVRRNFPLTPTQRDFIYSLSGGHPGYMLALMNAAYQNPTMLDTYREMERVSTLPLIDDESRRIWESFLESEKLGIMEYIRGTGNVSAYELKLLLLKGIIRRQGNGAVELFSPLFRAFIEKALQNNQAGTETQHLLPKRMLKVFLCHASSDKPIARDLYQKLSKIKGVSPWLDEINLIPGEDWKTVIQQEIKTTDLLLVCLSRNSTTKEGFVQKEIKLALDAADEKPEGQLFIIPVMFEECDVPTRLAKYHWLNYFDADAFNKLYSALKTRADYLGIGIEKG